MEPWDVVLFQRHPDDDPAETYPAEAFLDSCPDSVAVDLIAIIDAVAAGPPPHHRQHDPADPVTPEE